MNSSGFFAPPPKKMGIMDEVLPRKLPQSLDSFIIAKRER